jgi:hypothetical protein
MLDGEVAIDDRHQLDVGLPQVTLLTLDWLGPWRRRWEGGR